MILDTGTHEYLYCCRTTTKTIPYTTVNSTIITNTITITNTSTTTKNNNNYNNKHRNRKEFSLLPCV